MLAFRLPPRMRPPRPSVGWARARGLGPGGTAVARWRFRGGFRRGPLSVSPTSQEAVAAVRTQSHGGPGGLVGPAAGGGISRIELPSPWRRAAWARPLQGGVICTLESAAVCRWTQTAWGARQCVLSSCDIRYDSDPTALGSSGHRPQADSDAWQLGASASGLPSPCSCARAHVRTCARAQVLAHVRAWLTRVQHSSSSAPARTQLSEENMLARRSCANAGNSVCNVNKHYALITACNTQQMSAAALR